MSTVTRHRSTWGKSASGHPATPVDNEGPAIPGTPDDPAMDAYAMGDPSSWAEDPHPGPYAESGHPATPVDSEGPAWDKAAAMEDKAAKCIVIAMHMLGDPAGDRRKIKAVEAQAMSLLSLPMSHIASTLARISSEDETETEEVVEEAKKKAGEEVAEEEEVEEAKKKAALARKAAEEAEAELEAACKKAAGKKAECDAEPDGDEEAKKKSASISALVNRVARLERILIRLAAEETEEEEVVEEAKKKAGEEGVEEVEETEEAKKKAAFNDEDAALEAMLAEEGLGGEDATLEAMLAEEGMLGEETFYAEPQLVEEPVMEPDGFEFGFDSTSEDPMGLMDLQMSDEESILLASLHVQAGDETVEEDEEAKKKAARLAAASASAASNRTARTASASAPRPQPKTAGNGVTKLGGPVSRTASASVDNELEALWPSSPDVSRHF